MESNEKDEEYLRNVQRHIAYAAVAPTTLRSMFDRAHVRKEICETLSVIDVKRAFSAGLLVWLNEETEKLEQANGYWGPSRKALNLFLRDMANNYQMRRAFGLGRLDEDLEIPLDGKVMKYLRKARPGELPKAATVKWLTPEKHEQYQRVASEVARERGVSRAELDFYIWSD